MQQYQDVVAIIGPPGLMPIVGANVTVWNYGTSTNATIYNTNSTNNAVSNPLTTDSSGRYNFYAANGHYSLQVSGISIQTTVLTDILLNDPFDSGMVTFEDFGAIGDLIADDTVAVMNALSVRAGRAIYANGIGYKLSSQVAFQLNTSIESAGRFSSKFLKAFNGDFGTMAGNVTLTNITVDANSTTGKGFIVTGNNQTLNSCRLSGFADYCVHFSAAGSGSNFKMIGGEATRTSASDPSFGFPVTDAAGTPRYFIGMSTGGGIFGDMNGASDVFITNCFIRDLNWNDNSQIITMTGCRVAALAGDIHIKGGGHVITGNSIAATNIYLDLGTNGVTVRANGGYGTVIDNSGQTLNSYEYPRKTYTPVWNQPSSTQPVLGVGTIAGNTIRNGQTATFDILLTMGSSTTFGNATTGYQFSLPHQVYSQGRHTGMVFITDASTASTTIYSATLNAGTSIATIGLVAEAGAVRDGKPIAWATGDTILITGTYLCD